MNINEFKTEKKHDFYALEVIREALKARAEGNYGIGAILVDRDSGEILMRSHNNIFSRCRSDMHAEMSVITDFEEKLRKESREALRNSILFTSLEPCPMCLCRIITAGIPEVYHVADDEFGGMVHLYDNLPPVWKEIAEGRIFRKADCSEELEKAAFDIFLSTQSLDGEL